MKLVSELELGSNDAEDYKRKEMKQLFNEVFLKESVLGIIPKTIGITNNLVNTG